jgi:hypothetical protein
MGEDHQGGECEAVELNAFGLPGVPPHPLSSPAKAGDPVNTMLAVITGCPAFAAHDNRGAEKKLQSAPDLF